MRHTTPQWSATLFAVLLSTISVDSATAQLGNVLAPPSGRPVASDNLFQGREQQPSNFISAESSIVKYIESVMLAAESDGVIQTLAVEEGQNIPANSVMFKLDERMALADLAVATKEYESAKKESEDDANIRFAKLAAELAAVELEETQKLFDRGSSSMTELRRKRLDADKAALSLEVAQIEQVKKKLAAEVSLEKMEAAQVQLGMRSVVAPYDCTIAQRFHSQSDWVRAGEPLVRIINMENVRVEGAILADNWAPYELLNAPARIRVAISTRDSISIEGRIDFVSPVILSDGRVRVWAKVQNQKVGNEWLLREGMKAEMIIEPLVRK